MSVTPATGTPATGTQAIASLDDVSHWARGDGLEILLLILGSLLLARTTRWVSALVSARIVSRSLQGEALVRSEESKHRQAFAQVATWTFIALLFSVTAFLVVQRLGVPVTGLAAPAAVVGVALGLGAQHVVQDLLSGFFLITERQYGLGDLIRVSVIGVTTPVQGTVIDVSLRITTVRSANGEVVITPNGQMVQVTNLSRDWARTVIDVPVPVSVDVELVSDVLRKVGLAAFGDPDLSSLLLNPPTVMGVESMDVDQFSIRVVARTLPGKQFEVARALRVRIARALLSAGITVTLPVPAVTTGSSQAAS